MRGNSSGHPSRSGYTHSEPFIHPESQPMVNIQSQQGYTEFFSWGNDEDGQLGHGQESPNRKKIFNLPKSLSFEVLIQQVSCGFAHTAFISKQGYVFTFGSNSDGQLGVNDSGIKSSTAPLLVSDLITLQVTPLQVSCGGYHTAIVSSAGDVFLWGRNIQGQCGRSQTYNQFIFTPHKLHSETPLKQYSQVDCGDLHTSLVSKTGELYTFGDNSEGQLGIGLDYKPHSDRPALVTGISEQVIQASCGYRHTLVLTDHGTVFAFGSNKRFELGINSQQQKSSVPTKIPQIELYGIKQINAGGFSVALTNEGEVLVWGSGEFGQIQQPQKIYMDDIRFTDVSLSKSIDSFGSAIDTDGFVYTWGQNQFGQLGLGDFRYRKLPTKIPQLRKKKVRLIACGGGFVTALGKDVTDPSKKHHKKEKSQVTPKNQEPQLQSSQRSKSQSHIQSSSLRRKRNELHTLNENVAAGKIFNNSVIETNGTRSHERSSYYQTPAPILTHPVPTVVQDNRELSMERQRRIQLERDIKDKEYEIQSFKNQNQIHADLQSQNKQYKSDNQILREALEREQENSYKLLSDVHKCLAENQGIKEQMEDRQREIRALHLENKRQIERTRDLELDNDRLKQENVFIMQQRDIELSKLKNYVNELEKTINAQREVQNELMQSKTDQQRFIENNVAKIKSESEEMKRQIYNQQEKIKSLEYQLDCQVKENDDLKYDNTLLYEKNVTKDEKLKQQQDEIDQLKQLVDQERGRMSNQEKDTRYAQKKIHELEDQLRLESEKTKQKEQFLDDVAKDNERLRKDMEREIASRTQESDNLKRALDEQSYENENLRRTINCKQEEISSLNKIIQQSALNNSELVNTIKNLENVIKDVEEKNKKLNDLLNATIYNRAEQYKEKVINKLQERTPQTIITPNKQHIGYSQMQLNSDISELKNQPSPIRLQNILSDEKDQVHRERERLLKIADNMTKNYDLSRSVGGPSQRPLQEDHSFKKLQSTNISPFTNQNPSPSRVNTGFTQSVGMFNPSNLFRRTQIEDQNQNQQPPSRLRISDLGAGVPNYTPAALGYSVESYKETSPERIADILKQNSPLRRKLATDALNNRHQNQIVTDTYSPNRQAFNPYDDRGREEDTGGSMTASKITKKLVSSELEELKNQINAMQRDKQDLEQRLNHYESNRQ